MIACWTNGQIEDWVIEQLKKGTLEKDLIKYAQYWHYRLYGYYVKKKVEITKTITIL